MMECTNGWERDTMVNVEQIARWRATAGYLKIARHALPAPTPEHAQAYADLSKAYEDYLEHNELGLAFDVLEEMGHLAHPRGGFWRNMERAAGIMNLADRLPALREAFRAAPVPPKAE
jgi:hypothetical protein